MGAKEQASLGAPERSVNTCMHDPARRVASTMTSSWYALLAATTPTTKAMVATNSSLPSNLNHRLKDLTSHHALDDGHGPAAHLEVNAAHVLADDAEEQRVHAESEENQHRRGGEARRPGRAG